jgi:catechol 2,3-dioxygenase-like lactoylglutathione lyase family enzyme
MHSPGPVSKPAPPFASAGRLCFDAVGDAQARGREDVIRNLQHFALSVPDLEAGRRYYDTFGLEAAIRGNRLALRCVGRDQDQIVLTEGRKRRTDYLSFGTDEAGLAEAKAKLEAGGLPLLDPPGEGAPDGLWFRDPDGMLVNLQVAEAAPASAAPGERMNSPGDFRRLGVRGAPARGLRPRPRRLGHVLLFTPDVVRKTGFYAGMLGMRLSDTVGGHILAFLRSSGDSDHHVLAFAHSERSGFHHASFEVGSLDEIVLGAEHMTEAGYRSAWGLGRHVIGSNFFHYLRDPWNGLAEYFWDIDFVPEATEWEPKDWGPADGFFLWSTGGPPPADFVQNFEEG